MNKTVLKVATIIAGLLIANYILMHVIGFIALVLWLLFVVACLAGLAYFIYAFVQGKQAALPSQPKFLVWDTYNQSVQIFFDEPTIEDIVQGVSEPEKYLEAGKVQEVPNSTGVTILEDKGSMAVKIKIIDGNAKEKIGWVSRTLLVRSK
ncbi:MAG: hypothetical protein P4L53_10115 [Candidatus Obscuribacterales bacterium]|nr:hypothetical protein [Candidatus Obscuribacterales bacterium]